MSKKRRIVISLREGITLNQIFEKFDTALDAECIISSKNDYNEFKHKYPLLTKDINEESQHYKSIYYKSLGKVGKQKYRTFTLDFDNDFDFKKTFEHCGYNVDYIEQFYEDGIIEFLSTPNDSEFEKQKNVFQGLKIEDAWDIANQKGKNIIISVVDTGVDTNHNDLVQNLWKQPNQGGISKIGFTYPDNTKQEDSAGEEGHGTPVTGIIAAQGNNIGIIGIAPQSSVQMHKLQLTGDEVFMSECIKAIEKSRENNARIINCSFRVKENSSQTSIQEFQKSINDNSFQLLFVFASGNSNSIPRNPKNVTETFLNGLNNILKVGALNDNDEVADYSFFGSDVVYAYGNAFTTIKGNKFNIFSGTSAAAPQVAAICSLMMSYNSNISSREVKEIIELTTDKIMDKKIGLGRVNAHKAMKEVEKRWSPIA